jgi:hypothetical protein
MTTRGTWDGAMGIGVTGAAAGAGAEGAEAAATSITTAAAATTTTARAAGAEGGESVFTTTGVWELVVTGETTSESATMGIIVSSTAAAATIGGIPPAPTGG